MPLVVLTAGAQNPVWAHFADADLMARAHAGVDAMHREMAAAVPRGAHRVVPGASHGFLPMRHANAIADAVGTIRAAA